MKDAKLAHPQGVPAGVGPSGARGNQQRKGVATHDRDQGNRNESVLQPFI